MASGSSDEIKQVIIMRKDLDMGVGKMCAQCGHAVLLSNSEVWKVDPEVAKKWYDTGQKKIVLKVDDEESLRKLYAAFKYKKIPCALVEDAGLTQLEPGTATALGVGPWRSSEIDQFTSKLKLL